jgi:hypothetical protein
VARAGVGSGGSAGMSGSVTGSSGLLNVSGGLGNASGSLGALHASGGLQASGSLHASGPLNASGSFHGSESFAAPPAPTNRFAAAEASGHMSGSLSGHLNVPPPPPPPVPQNIPVATVVPQARKAASIPVAGWVGIAAGVVIAGGAVAWVMMNGAKSPQYTAPTAPPPTVAIAPAPAPTAPVAAAERQEPTPSAAPQVSQPTPPPVKVTQAAAPVTPPAPVPTATVAAKDDLPPGVLRPRDDDALKKIANGDDPSHPDKRAVVQGKVVYAGVSPTGKVYHIRFAGVGGSGAFEVVYFQSGGMFEKMQERFGDEVGVALIGKNIRVSGRMRVVNDGPEMVLDSPDNVLILN